MIQVVVLRVEAELHVVRALGPARVGAELHLVVGVVAHLARRHQRPRAHVEHRGRAVARSRRLAGVGNREVVAPAFVFRSLRSDPAVIRRVAEHTVDDERLRQDGSGKHRSARDVGLPEAADALRVVLGAVERRKDAVAVLPAREPADAVVQVQAVARGPRHLRVDLVQRRFEVVARVVVVRIPRPRRQHEPGEQAARDRIDPVFRDVVAAREPWIVNRGQARAVGERKRDAPDAIRTCQRIVDNRIRVAELAGPQVRRGQRVQAGRAGRHLAFGELHRAVLHTPHLALDAHKEEQLVPHNRPADRAAEDVLVVLAFVGARWEEVRPVLERRGREVFEQRPTHRVRAAFHLHVDRRAARHALIGIEAVRDDADRFDRLEGRAVGLDVGIPLIGDRRAVDSEKRVVRRLAVDRHAHRSSGVVDAARLNHVRRRHSGHQSNEALIRTAGRRQVDDLLARRLHLHRRAFGLEHSGCARHEHGLLQRANREPHVHAHRRVLPDDDVPRTGRLEPGERHVDLICAGRNVWKVVTAGRVCRGFARLCGFDVGNLDGRSRHSETGVIGHVAEQSAVQGLGRHGKCAGDHEDRAHRHSGPKGKRSYLPQPHISILLVTTRLDPYVNRTGPVCNLYG